MSHPVWTIAGTYAHIMGIYLPANAMTMRDGERLLFLLAAVRDLARCVQKKQEHLYEIAIAQSTGWYSSVVEERFREAGGDILTTAMGEKFPLHRCGYCGQLPCACTQDTRGDHRPATCAPEQRLWSVKQWQDHLWRMYGNNNSQVGIDRVFSRLFQEIAEIALVLHHADGWNDSQMEFRRKLSFELIDVWAWILGIASLLGIDAEQAIRSLYELGCPVCGKNPCSCRSYEKRPTGLWTHRYMSAEDIYQLTGGRTTASA